MYVNGGASFELLLLFWWFLMGSFLCCFSVCGKLHFPALGFIADESISTPRYTDSITAAPEVPAIRGLRAETQAEISIRQQGLETRLYGLVSF